MPRHMIAACLLAGLPALCSAVLPAGVWEEDIRSLPTGQLAQVPLLGNGYVGVALDYWANGTGQVGPHQRGAVDMWVNTQAVWACDAATPAPRCARAAFGGLSLRIDPALSSSFRAEQRMQPLPALATNQSSDAGTLQTTTWMHPEEDTVVTDVEWHPAGGTACLQVDVLAWVLDTVAQPSAAGQSASDPSVLWVSRRGSDSTAAAPKNVWTALASAVSGANVTAHGGTTASNGFRQVGLSAQVCRGTAMRIVTAVRDNTVTGNSHDPAPDAAAAAPAADVEAAAQRRQAYWDAFWAVSSIDLPNHPQITAGWHASQYIAAVGLGRAGGPPSGLYGPWVTVDTPEWNGDYTLDYNQEAQFYGVFSSNRAGLGEAYVGPIYDFMPVARGMAQEQAEKAKVTCSASTLHYPCHLAPWGYQSKDTNVFMHWNGMFAALPVISLWEYTQQVDPRAYALLDGLNAWSHCFLRNNSLTGHLEDSNLHNPDEEHENQKVKNPQIALALMRRTAEAQVALAEATGQTAPEYVHDIAARLAPFNKAVLEDVWTAYHDALPVESDAFSLYPVWPSEAVQVFSDEATRKRARKSVKHYADFVKGRPVLVFSAAVRAGSDDESGVYSRAEIADSLEAYYTGRGPSGAPSARGGGTENIGVVAAVNDMLLQCPGMQYIAVFPVWPAGQPAAFRNLLAKGGVRVSSSVAAGHVGNITLASLPGVPVKNISVLLPWESGARVACAGRDVPYTQVTPEGAQGRHAARFELPAAGSAECVVLPSA